MFRLSQIVIFLAATFLSLHVIKEQKFCYIVGFGISHLFYLRLPRFKANILGSWKEILVFATPYILNANLKSLISYFDRFWIAQKLSDYELANYTLLFSVAGIVNFINFFTMTNQEKHLYQGNFDYEAAKYLKQSDVLGFLSMVVVIPFFTFLNPQNDNQLLNASFLGLLMLVNSFMSNYSIIIVRLNQSNQRHLLPIITGLGAGFTIIFCLALIPSLGILGAIISTFISTSLTYLVVFRQFTRRETFHLLAKISAFLLLLSFHFQYVA